MHCEFRTNQLRDFAMGDQVACVLSLVPWDWHSDIKKLKTYFERFSNQVEPKCNPVFSRHKFHKRVKTEAETGEKCVTDLKLLVKECSYKEPNEVIRDRIVFGTNSRKNSRKVSQRR